MRGSKPVGPGVGADLAVALITPKYPHNVGAAVRAASCYGVSQVWFSGDRVSMEARGKGYRLPREERMKGYGEVALAHSERIFDAFPAGVVPVAIEIVPGAELLPYFEHPEKALYVFGPEDGGLNRVVLGQCHKFVRIPMLHCANLASAVYTVLYDRHAKSVAAGREEPLELAETRGWCEPEELTIP